MAIGWRLLIIAGGRLNGDDTLLMLGRDAVARKVGPVVHCMRVSKAFIDEMHKMGAVTYFRFLITMRFVPKLKK